MTGPIARGTIRTIFVLGLRLAVQAGTLLVVARMLGPRQFGAFAGVAALAVILGTFSTFGTHLILLGEVSKDPTRRQLVLSYAVPTTLVCGAVLLLVYLAITTIALGGAGLALHVLVLIGVTETLLQPLFSFPATEHLALGRIARSQLLAILPLVLRLATAAAVLLLALHDPLAAYAWGYLGASLVALAFASATLPSAWPHPRTWRLAHKAELRQAAGYAAINVTRTGPAELDKTLALKLLPLGAAGVYAAGARVIGAITLPITAMTMSSLPRLFREGRTQPMRTLHLLRWMFATAAAYGIVLAILLWLIAPAFDWIFGPQFQGLSAMVRWLCLAIPGMALRLVAGNVLMAVGKPWIRVGFEAAGLAILVFASVLLTINAGTIGMPLALACSEWGMAIVGLAFVAHQCGLTAPTQCVSDIQGSRHRKW
jgi:O-antigen/teichoic acid export membrane protein